MPEIELPPDDYRVRTKRGWITRDDFRVTMPYAAVVAALFIGFAWWHRAELPLVAIVATVGVASFLFGVLVGAWLKRFD
jgi:hypothetical protein